MRDSNGKIIVSEKIHPKGNRNMKKIFVLCLVSVLAVSVSACSDKPETDDVSRDQSIAGSSEPSAEESSKDEKELLNNCFGQLFNADELYIKADITVESDLSPSETNSYELTVAADKTSNMAMTLMTMPDGQKAHMIVRNNYSYQLDDENETYKKQLYTESVDDFIRPYTAELYLGVTAPLIYEASGSEEIDTDSDGKKEHADYIRFRMSQNEISADKNSEVYITYYFINDRPVMEVMEKTGGRTVFLFRELCDKIPDRTVFEIDDSYIGE